MLLLFVIQDHNDLKMQSKKKKKKNGNRDCQNQPDIIKKEILIQLFHAE